MINDLRDKRLAVLSGIWDRLVESGKFSNDESELNKTLASEAVLHYAKDVEILKLRYEIDDKIQVPKVAGLMAGAILRFRPVVPLVDEFSKEEYLFANETLAIYHGLCVCGEFSGTGALENLIERDFFDSWLKNFIYLLHYRNHTPESLVFVFDTLSRFVFPEAFKTTK